MSVEAAWEPSSSQGLDVSVSGPVTVRQLLGVLRRWQVRVLAGEAGLDQPVTWASAMRARLPAFEGFHGGELALISLPVLRSLRSQVVALSLPGAVRQLAETGVAAIALGGLPQGQPPPDEAAGLDEAIALASHLGLPLLALPATYLGEVEHDVIAHLMAHREAQSAATEPSPAEAARLRASLRSEALDALLTGTYAGEAAMRARAAQLGYDLTQPHAVLWVDLAPHAPSGSGALGPRGADPAAAHLAEELATTLGAWSRPLAGQVSALLPLARLERSNGEVAERTEALLARTLGARARPGTAEWSAGLGEPATAPAQVHRSANEARDAARLGLLVLGPHRLARPADLGVYRLLLALRDDGNLAPFVERTLAPLLADARNGDALVETLDIFFACNGNLSEAARRLHLHRNSLIYRLNRAHELLGRDLDDPELRLALQLAIKGRRVLDL